jgi:hypothetical protein
MAMRAADDTPIMTAEELSYLDIPDKTVELVRGRLLVMEPPSTEHGRIQANLLIIIRGFIRANHLGVVFGQDTGFKVGANPDTVRGPDVSFAATERIAEIPPRGFAAFAPDLIAEAFRQAIDLGSCWRGSGISSKRVLASGGSSTHGAPRHTSTAPMEASPSLPPTVGSKVKTYSLAFAAVSPTC